MIIKIRPQNSNVFHKIFLRFETLLIVLLLFSNNCEAQIFTKLTSPSLKFNSAGCGWFDFNNDNNLDAYLTFFNSGNYLIGNDGKGNLNLVNSGEMIPSGNNYSGITFGDYDNDGNTDLYITSMNGANALYSNAGNGHFQRIIGSTATKDGGSFLSANWADYDNDGNLDLLVTNSGTGFNPGGGNLNFLYKNNGDGTFTKVTDNVVGTTRTYSAAAAFADMDNDGDQDLFMTEWGKDNWLFENNGDGSFTKISGKEINSNRSISISCSWGDYDNDGYLDLFVGNGSTSQTVKQKNYLFHNNGDKTFTKITEGDIANYSGCVWTSAWGDVDNDGDIDLYIGTIYEKEELLYLNNGDGTFTTKHDFEINNTEAGTGITGASFGDYDNDGCLDLLLADAGAAGPFIYHNNGNSNHWVSVQCAGIASNRSAIGARVKIKATINGKSTWQIREISPNQGFRGSNDLRTHFGLGDAASIDSLVVIWPSGAKSVQTNIAVNRFVNITEDVPANYLKPLFNADLLKGKAELTVHFTDKSIADINHPISSWSWDFDNDGKEDSKEQNPVYTFNNEAGATYSVALTISNGISNKTFVKANYIQLLPRFNTNLALYSKVSASSLESSGFEPRYAADGEMTTRWASGFSDPQWFMVELDSVYKISKVTLRWESAYGKSYQIQTAVDTSAWQTVFTEAKSNGGNDVLNFAPVDAKYVRMYGTARATAYGYSLYEFEVNRAPVTDVEKSKNIQGSFNLQPNFPNPFNPETVISYEVPSISKVELKVFDTLGRETVVLFKGEQAAGSYKIKFDGTGLSSGIYFCRISVSDPSGNSPKFVKTNKMVLMR